MDVNLSMLIDVIYELECVPNNKWNRIELNRLESVVKKVREIVEINERGHRDWHERYSLKFNEQQKEGG